MFRLTSNEKAEVVANCDHLARLKFSPNLPFAFTEHGVLMLANVLKSRGALQASVAIVRAFIKYREMATAQKEFARKLADLEGRVSRQEARMESVFDEIRGWMAPPDKPAKRIGFAP